MMNNNNYAEMIEIAWNLRMEAANKHTEALGIALDNGWKTDDEEAFALAEKMWKECDRLQAETDAFDAIIKRLQEKMEKAC